MPPYTSCVHTHTHTIIIKFLKCSACQSWVCNSVAEHLPPMSIAVDQFPVPYTHTLTHACTLTFYLNDKLMKYTLNFHFEVICSACRQQMLEKNTVFYFRRHNRMPCFLQWEVEVLTSCSILNQNFTSESCLGGLFLHKSPLWLSREP